MDKILGVIGGVPHAKLRSDDDFADRLSYRYTSAIFILFAIVVSTKQYVGEPISCWVPAHFTGNHEEYANNYCWIRNTYSLPYEEYIPRENEPEKRARGLVPYYQWIPIILLVQALLFYMPILVWRGMTSHSGIDVSSLVKAGDTFTNTDAVETRDKTLRFMTSQMDR